jgi:hypothetical protein
LTPGAYRRVDDISEAAGCVTVRYRLDHAVPVGITSLGRPGNFLGYSIYETREGHIVRAGHFFVEQRDHRELYAPETAVGAILPPDSVVHRRSRRQWILASLTLLLSVLLAEPVWAAPVVATTAWRGGTFAFALFFPLYVAIGYGASLLIIHRAVTRNAAGRIERWLSAEADRRHLRRIRRLVQAGTFFGFVLSSVFLGAIVTTWLLMQFGGRRHIRRDAIASSVFFSTFFVGFYAGVASLIF